MSPFLPSLSSFSLFTRLLTGDSRSTPVSDLPLFDCLRRPTHEESIFRIFVHGDDVNAKSVGLTSVVKEISSHTFYDLHIQPQEPTSVILDGERIMEFIL